MEKLSIREASQRFGISRARLYKLLDKGAVTGYKGHEGSWISIDSLQIHVSTRDSRHGQGRPKVEIEGDYVPARVAALKSGYTKDHVNYLVRKGYVTTRKAKGGRLIYYPDLLKYKEK